MTGFLSSLSSLLQVALLLAILGIVFFVARRWRLVRLRRLVRGALPLKEEIKQAVSEVLNADVLEVASLGAVTYLDVAWQYSVADPQIWQHLDGAGAAHAADAMADPALLQAGLGDHAPAVLGQVADHLQHAAAIQSFDHSLDQVMGLGPELPNTLALLDGHPQSLIDILVHKGQAADAVGAKAQGLSDGTSSALGDVKASALDAKAAAIDAKTAALVDAKASAVADAHTNLLDTPWDAGDLVHYVPLVTIGFATYRAWRRAENGTHWGRNVEFAATEVITRSGGALAGAKVGGTVGTLVVPGSGTVVGSVVGAVGGALAGARLGEEIKRRHMRQAERELDQALHNLGAPYMADPVGLRRLQRVFEEQQQTAHENVTITRRQYARHARWWRRLWPDQKLVLLQETVREADARMLEVRQQMRDTLERIEVLRRQENYKALGLVLWNAPTMCRRLGCAQPLVDQVDQANRRLRYELQQVGATPA
jgi:hypothetical protein